MELQQDDKGMTSFLPVIEWGVATAQDGNIGLLFDYVAGHDDFQGPRKMRIQLILIPEHARRFGETLIEHALKSEHRAKGDNA